MVAGRCNLFKIYTAANTHGHLNGIKGYRGTEVVLQTLTKMPFSSIQ
jgi:hypothetical protein